MNTISFAARVLPVTALGTLLVISVLAEDGEHYGRKEKYLYVWAGTSRAGLSRRYQL